MSGHEHCEAIVLPIPTVSVNTERPGLWRQWREDLACVFERDPAARNRFEVFVTYPGVQAIMAYRLAHRLWGAGLRFPARFLAYLTRAWTNIEIHPAARIGRRFFIDHGAGVVIGETAEVGDNCTLYHGVTLGGTTWNKGKRHPTLGNGVVVGAGAKILGPITLGEEAKVGANSVVIADVPARRTVVGIPAKVVKGRKERRANPHGIDLDHHLIPDPVAEAVACLLERIRELEIRAGIANHRAAEDEPEHRCSDCDALGVCVRHGEKH